MNPVLQFNKEEVIDNFKLGIKESNSKFDPNKINIPTNTKFDEKTITIYAALSGVKKENIKIELNGQTLKIIAERKFDYETGIHNDEIKNGELCKFIKLEPKIDATLAKSTFIDGLLTIELPKIIDLEVVNIKID